MGKKCIRIYSNLIIIGSWLKRYAFLQDIDKAQWIDLGLIWAFVLSLVRNKNKLDIGRACLRAHPLKRAQVGKLPLVHWTESLVYVNKTYINLTQLSFSSKFKIVNLLDNNMQRVAKTPIKKPGTRKFWKLTSVFISSCQDGSLVCSL